MSYIKEHLNPGERIVYRTTLHPIIFTWGALEVLGSLIFYDQDPRAGLLFLIGCIVLLYEGVRFSTSEFAVTNTRVVIKTGWFNRRSLEVQLAKVEAVAVDQGPLGHLLDYGTLTVGGTGGTKEKITLVRAPIVLRKQIQQQIEQQPAVRLSGHAEPGASPGRVN